MAIVWQEEYQEALDKYSDLVAVTWKQIQKDFAMEAIGLKDAEITALNDIYEALYPHVTQLIQFDFNGVMRLLYRIDISEQKVKRQMDLIPDDTARAISILIVKREIQKVVLRKQYSQ